MNEVRISAALRELRGQLTARPVEAWPATASTEWVWGVGASGAKALVERVARLTPKHLATTADGMGQRRAIYPLALLAWALETAAGAADLADYVPALTGLLVDVAQPAEPGGRLWWARAQLAAGAGDAARAVVGAVLEAQHDDGRLHELDASTNLDTFVYDELVALHALGTLAARRDERAWATAAARCADFHSANTQPDNTTHEPWALAVFAARARTAPFAEQQLHDARTLLARRSGPAPGLMAALLTEADILLAAGRLRRALAEL